MKEFILILITMNAQTGYIVDAEPVANEPVYHSLEECLFRTTQMPAQKREGTTVKTYGCRTDVPSKNPSQSNL